MEDTVKAFEDNEDQAEQLPEKFQFDADEMMVQKLGDAVLLAPKSSAWNVFVDGLEGFTDDIFDGGRDQGVQQEREPLA